MREREDVSFRSLDTARLGLVGNEELSWGARVEFNDVLRAADVDIGLLGSRLVSSIDGITDGGVEGREQVVSQIGLPLPEDARSRRGTTVNDGSLDDSCTRRRRGVRRADVELRHRAHRYRRNNLLHGHNLHSRLLLHDSGSGHGDLGRSRRLGRELERGRVTGIRREAR